MRTHEFTTETAARSVWHRFCDAYGLENCRLTYQDGCYTITIDEAGNVARMAETLGIEAGALRSLLGFLRERLERIPGGLEAFAAASSQKQDAILRASVEAWHDCGQRLFSELLENKTVRAQHARQVIAEEAWHCCQVIHKG